MWLAESSRAELELFFREFLRDERVRLPRVRLHAGGGARWLTRAGRIAAITFGRRVFVAPSLLRRRGGRWAMSGRLMAHEAAHVLQYERAGALRFLLRYSREYFAGLWRAGKFDAGSRVRAYRDISFEREARAAEHAFAGWSGRAGRAAGATDREDGGE
ncbi:MAG: DUF4157 domain-containing protein [Acidobacteria bacterium]|nr:DUF4157 domain-containing protein [Acidobacteriota bacterium]